MVKDTFHLVVRWNVNIRENIAWKMLKLSWIIECEFRLRSLFTCTHSYGSESVGKKYSHSGATNYTSIFVEKY